jgi:hypothetical protein
MKSSSKKNTLKLGKKAIVNLSIENMELILGGVKLTTATNTIENNCETDRGCETIRNCPATH